MQTKESEANISDIRAKLSGLGLGEVQIQEFGAPNDILVRISAQPTEQEQQASIAKVKGALGDTVDYRRIEVVGPTVSGELIAGGTVAVVIAMIAILIYIWFRFEWQFAVAAIASLVHDVTGTIGLYSALQLEFNLSSIAAILTIIGYSLNDKVVIFDRIRENLRKYRKMPLTELLDLSINETLSRTVLTHVTTFLAMMPFVLVGGEAIFGFALAMVWGIVIGAYSSIYVAAPLQLILGVKREGHMVAPAKAKERAGARASAQARPVRQDGRPLGPTRTKRRCPRHRPRGRSRPLSVRTVRSAPPARDGLLALYAFNAELACIAEQVTEPGLGEIRLQWWRDALDHAAAGMSTGHPVVDALGEIMLERGVSREDVARVIDSRQFDVSVKLMPHRDALDTYLAETAGALVRLGVEITGDGRQADEASKAASQASKAAGLAYGLTGLMRALPVHAARGRINVPADMLLPGAPLRGELAQGKTPRALIRCLLNYAATRGPSLREALICLGTTVRQESAPPFGRWLWSNPISARWRAATPCIASPTSIRFTVCGGSGLTAIGPRPLRSRHRRRASGRDRRGRAYSSPASAPASCCRACP